MRITDVSSHASVTVATTTMPTDNGKKPTPSRRPIANGEPKASAGPYLVPRLAGSPAVKSSPDLGRTAQNKGTPKATPKTGATTPVKPQLNTNITPRSGPRRARVDSASSTPSQTPLVTPTNSRPASLLAHKDLSISDAFYKCDNASLGEPLGRVPSNSSAASSRTAGLPFKGVSPESLNRGRAPPANDSSPMFFHASDAKAANTKAGGQSQGFFYANGQQERPISMPVGGLGLQRDHFQAKFFHVNGMPEAQDEQKVSSNTPPPRSRSSPKLASSARPTQARSPSPLKEIHRPATMHVKSSPHVPLDEPSISSQIKSPPSEVGRVQKAMHSSPPKPIRLHRKSHSVGSSTVHSECESMPTIMASPLTAEPPSMAHTLQPTDVHEHPIPSPISPLASPIRSMTAGSSSAGGKDHMERLSALAAEARRERKVLDLEISNSSLLAINRTLEREMRKQNAELRRFRRLTSAGRLSFTPSNARLSTNTLATDDDSSVFDNSFDATEDESDLDADDSFGSDDDDDGSSAASLSPSAQAARDARQRRRDERRLRLDLSKHRQLLVDSQRMNESLKRCLGWTEALIGEGKKALAYSVGAADVKLGGRVLSADENADEEGGDGSDGGDTVPAAEGGKALLSPVSEVGSFKWGREQEGSVEAATERALGRIVEESAVPA